MDFLFTHCAPFPRQFPSSFPVESIGYLPEKTDWTSRKFATCNFSFILSGNGEFRRKGHQWNVNAPCVITQWPGEHPEYGATGRDGRWEELFLIYSASRFLAFQRCGFIDLARPVWEIQRPENFRAGLEELKALLRHAERPGMADRIDRACETLILESLLGTNPHEEGSQERTLETLRKRLGEDPAMPVDWETEARRIGLSPSTFRRRWIQLFHNPPGRSLADARIRQARRLLVETRLSVKEVASRCGFEDALYFSRRFREVTGLPAREYRKRHRPDHGV